MSKRYNPADIFEFLAARVVGQDPVLRQIAVGVYKHLQGLRNSNILLIGNSGTGKTTIMRAIIAFYREHPDLEKFATLSIMNANSLVGEDGEVRLSRLFRNLEADARREIGDAFDPEALRERMENATVCLDEVDKISSRIAGRTNVAGISIQQALLTVLEGEVTSYETAPDAAGRRHRFAVNTRRVQFVAGGAFEELYDQIYKLVENKEDERRFTESSEWDDATGRMRKTIYFTLREYLKLSDLFAYGMVPQFISRFSSVAVLDDLGRPALKKIFLGAPDSPYRHAKEYFASFGIDLRFDDASVDRIVADAATNARIGARALQETLGRVLAELEFNPPASPELRQAGDHKVIPVTKAVVEKGLAR